MAVPSVFRLFYLAFRMGPFLVVLYFMLYALLRQDMTYLIYLMGVIMACFFGIITGGLWTSRITDSPETVCHPLRLGTGERLSVLPLSIVVYVFTLCYFSVPIFQKKTQSDNVMFLTSFVFLIFIDLLWIWLFSCSTFFRMVVAGTVGITVGLSWGQIVYDLKLTSFFSDGRENSCLMPTPVAKADPSSGQHDPKYICVRRRRIEYLPVESKKEGLTTMTTTPVSNNQTTTPFSNSQPTNSSPTLGTTVPYSFTNTTDTSSTQIASTSSPQTRQIRSAPASFVQTDSAMGPLVGPTISPEMRNLLASPPDPTQPTTPPPPLDVATMRSLCYQANKVLTGQQAVLSGKENQPYVADLYDNLTFHQKNIATLLTAINSETSSTISDPKRIDYYKQFDKTILQNAADSLTQLQSVQSKMDPPLYAQFNKTFMDLGKLFRQLPM